MGTTFVVNTSLTTVVCGECSGTYAIQERYREECQKKGESWTCPYCKTGWGYSGNSDNEKLKRENERLQCRITNLACQVTQRSHERDHFRKSRDAIKGVVTKIKKRVANGVCPCCKRSFANLHAHMANQHPAYAEPAS